MRVKHATVLTHNLNVKETSIMIRNVKAVLAVAVLVLVTFGAAKDNPLACELSEGNL